MRKAITTICVVGGLLIILDGFNAANALMLFVFTGVIPGTDVRISAVDMMSATATAITVVILRITVWPSFRTFFFIEPAKPAVRRTKRTTRRTA